MKQLLGLFVVAGLMAGCGNNEPAKEHAATGDTATTPAATQADTGKAGSVTLKDSIMTFKDGKVLISIAGEWKPLTASVTTSNGRKVSPDGEVSKGAVKRKMEEGMMIDKDGQMTDKNGKPMDNTGWE